MFNKKEIEGLKYNIKNIEDNIQYRLSRLEDLIIGEVYYEKQWIRFSKSDFIDRVDNKVKVRVNGFKSIWIDQKYVIFYNFKDTKEFQDKKKEIEKLK